MNFKKLTLCGAARILDFGGAGSQRVVSMLLLSFLVTPMAVGIAHQRLTLYDQSVLVST